MVMGVFDCARRSDQGLIDRHLIRCSIRQNPKLEHLYDEDMRCGGCALGHWCCKNSMRPWCKACGHNFLWSGVDDGIINITDHIHDLLWLPKCTAAVERLTPGKLEAALALIERVSRGQKPLGQIVMDALSDAEAELVRGAAAHASREHQVVVREYVRPRGTKMLGCCLRGRRVGDLISLEGLAALYARADLPCAAAEIDVWRQTLRSPALGPDALVSRWLTSAFFASDDETSWWLAGVLLGQPLWTTVARYHSTKEAPEPPAGASPKKQRWEPVCDEDPLDIGATTPSTADIMRWDVPWEVMPMGEVTA